MKESKQTRKNRRMSTKGKVARKFARLQYLGTFRGGK